MDTVDTDAVSWRTKCVSGALEEPLGKKRNVKLKPLNTHISLRIPTLIRSSYPPPSNLSLP